MKCWFCNKEEALENKGYEVEMFGDVMQSQRNAEESVSFNKKLVVVPRCASCKSRQKKAKAAGGLAILFLVLTAAAAVLGLFNWVEGYVWGIALGFSAGMVIEFLTVRGMAMKGIRSEAFARNRHEEVMRLKDKGYQFGRAPVQHKVNQALIEED